MVLVDSSAWFASLVPTDSHHSAALGWLTRNSLSLATTDYIFDETMTLLRVRGQNIRAVRWAEQMLAGNIAVIHYTSEERIGRAWAVFRDYSDKNWSFTDCVSKAVMDELEIKIAFAFDRHFRQFGTVTVVP
jgi:uncharacterized protein